MKTIEVSAERNYQVVIVNSWAAEVRAAIRGMRAIAIVPQQLQSQVLSKFPDLEILTVPNGEDQKSFRVFEKILTELAERRLDRSTCIVGIGGGATTDLAGFVAATYLRGVNWVAVPTTVAGMVDAAIGGKTGINLEAGKNLVGAFHSPNRVIVDLSWLEQLPARDRNAGLAEAIKCGFIADPVILDLFEGDPLSALGEVVARAISVKARVVGVDFKESYEREALNYGHTLGHAIERHSGYELRHGEAISIGMVFAANISARYAGLDSAVVAQHVRLLSGLNLPTSYKAEAWNELFELMQVDKKRRGSTLRFVTLPRLGATDRLDSIAEAELEDIYRSAIAR